MKCCASCDCRGKSQGQGMVGGEANLLIDCYIVGNVKLFQ